jgi:hypothetical protein
MMSVMFHWDRCQRSDCARVLDQSTAIEVIHRELPSYAHAQWQQAACLFEYSCGGLLLCLDSVRDTVNSRI